MTTINLGPITREEGLKRAKAHSSITRWFERWNSVSCKFDFYLIFNENQITNYEI